MILERNHRSAPQAEHFFDELKALALFQRMVSEDVVVPVAVLVAV